MSYRDLRKIEDRLKYAEIQEPSDLVRKLQLQYIVSMTFILLKIHVANRRICAKIWYF